MKRLVAAWILGIFLLAAGCSEQPAYRTVEGAMLGTSLRMIVQTTDSGAALYESAMQVDQAMKNSMSIFDEGSLLSRLNRNETDSVDRHIIRNLTLAQEVAAWSDGYYDVTVGPLVRAWGFAGQTKETEPNLDSLLEFVGGDKVALRNEEGRITLWKADPRVQLDFNSIAKGYTVDLLTEELQRRGVANFLVDIGGEVRCCGVNSAGNPWRIGIERPVEGALPGESCEMRIALNCGALATSGNYRRYFVDPSGRKVAHTIDPHTGRSLLSRLLSATVSAETCARADAMATMFMALGAEKALQLMEAHPEWAVLLILAPEKEGEAMECHLTPAMQRLVLE